MAQENLITYINENQVKVLLVRSATKVTKEMVDNCPSLEIIGRGGVGMDNIEVAYAREKGKNTSSIHLQRLRNLLQNWFLHIFSSGSRFLQDSNRQMPVER